MENIFQIPEQNHLYMYNRNHQRLEPNQLNDTLKPLPFYFFGSGSSGNSVYLTRLHTLIDLGFPYNHYTNLNPNFFLDVDFLILTHEHNDHFKFPTFYKILTNAPNVKIIISKRMFEVITESDQNKNKIAKQVSGNFTEKINAIKTTYKNRFIIIESSQQQAIPLTTRHNLEFWFTPHMVSHGPIQNMAIEISTYQYDIHLLYSSDIDHLLDDTGSDVAHNMGLPINYTTTEDLQNPNFFPYSHALTINPLKNPFNLLFLEANYDEHVLEPILEHDPYNVRALSNKRHISEQEAWRYVNYSLSSDGIFIPLHASSTFGTLIQDLN